MSAGPPDVDTIARRSYDEWLDVCAAEQQRFDAVLGPLGADDWSRPTDCAAWTVRDLCGHVLGSLLDNSSARRGMTSWRHAQRDARRDRVDPLDALSGAQVRRFAALPDDEVASTFRTLAPRNLAGRRRVPRLLRRAPVTVGGEHVTLGHILGVVLTRDLWMHRLDVTRATAIAPVVSADHDGVIVADVVADWASGHGQPFTLTLDGPAGGAWGHGTGGPDLRLDALAFARATSGRGAATGLLAQRVLF